MEGTIYITGTIGDCGEDEKGVELVDVISQVKKQPDATRFKVVINSEGGLVSTGFNIYNYLTSLGMPIETVGTGMVASIATVIFMAGQKRRVEDETLFMIHLPMGGVRGTADEIAEYSKEIKAIENQVVNFYMDKIGIPKEAIEPLLKEETFLTRGQLADLGITNEGVAELQVAAKADREITKAKIDKMKNKKTKNDKSFIDKIMALINDEKDIDVVVNKILFDAENKEVEFPEVAEEDAIQVGDKAMHDGEIPTGEIVLADGRTLVFGEGGVLDSIVEAEEESEEGTDEELAKLKEDLAEALRKNEELESEKAEIQAKLDKKEAVINKIKKFAPEFEVDTTRDKRSNKKTKAPSRFEKAMANLKNK